MTYRRLPFLAVLLALTACATPPPPVATVPPPPPLPLAVKNGAGSQYGNYAAEVAGEMRGPKGERCVLFNWDRPLTADLVIRLQSASCEIPGFPGPMICHEVSRTVIPMSESHLREESETDEP